MESISLLDDTHSVQGYEKRIIHSKYPPPKEQSNSPLKFLKTAVFIIIGLFLFPLILSVILFILSILIILTITCILPGYNYFRSKAEKKKLSQPKNMIHIDVGGYKVAVAYSDNCLESDNSKPAVIFLPGVGMPPTVIFQMVCEYMPEFLLIAYDKGGSGSSEDVPRSHAWSHRDCKSICSELHALIHSNQFPVQKEKFLFLGGSQGGLMAQYYYYTYPEDVAALLFMDPSTEDFYSAAPGIINFGLNFAPVLYSIAPIFCHFGWMRLYQDFGVSDKGMFELIPTKYRRTVVEIFLCARSMTSMRDDFVGFSDSCETVRSRRKEVGKIKVPIAVMTGTNWSASAPAYTPIWLKVQTDNIATQSVDSIHVILPNDDHGQCCMGEYELVKQLCGELCDKVKK